MAKWGEIPGGGFGSECFPDRPEADFTTPAPKRYRAVGGVVSGRQGTDILFREDCPVQLIALRQCIDDALAQQEATQ